MQQHDTGRKKLDYSAYKRPMAMRIKVFIRFTRFDGPNCSESCIVVQRFIKMLLVGIRNIEESVMACSHIGKQLNVKFSFTELPNDMKI